MRTRSSPGTVIRALGTSQSNIPSDPRRADTSAGESSCPGSPSGIRTQPSSDDRAGGGEPATAAPLGGVDAAGPPWTCGPGDALGDDAVPGSAVDDSMGDGLALGEARGSGLDVATGRAVAAATGVGLGVDVGLGVGVDLGLGLGVDVGRGVGVGSGVGFGVGVGVGLGVGVGSGGSTIDSIGMVGPATLLEVSHFS